MAKEANGVRDEERSYIVFFRYLNLISNIKKSDIYLKDKGYYEEMIGITKVRDAVNRLEELETSLKKRYLEPEESPKWITNQFKDLSTQMITNYGYPLIDCNTLVEELENSRQLTRITIF